MQEKLEKRFSSMVDPFFTYEKKEFDYMELWTLFVRDEHSMYLLMNLKTWTKLGQHGEMS